MAVTPVNGDMLVQEGSCPQARAPGILDSPTLARVERAMLRHDDGSRRDVALLQRAAFTQVGYKISFVIKCYRRGSTTFQSKSVWVIIDTI